MVSFDLMSDRNIEEKLGERMLAAFNEAKRLKYNAARFFQMLTDRGPLATAKTLLAGDVSKVSDGFTAMWDLQRLDLTVEAISLDPELKPLFTEQELDTARKRLENAGYFKRTEARFQSESALRQNPVAPLKVFLCHSKLDKDEVGKLYQDLKKDGFSPWLDEEDLIPGQSWRDEIPAAVRSSHVVVVCLSKGSITREGYVQKEIKIALDVAEEKPPGTIFIIPALLEEGVNVPERLSNWHWVNLFDEKGYQKLADALMARANSLPAKASNRSKKFNSLQVFNFTGTPGPIFISGSQHSVHGPLMDLWGVVTVVNYTQGPIKIWMELVLDSPNYSLSRFFFRLRSKPERFERISLLGNSKEDYELHFMFPDNQYPKGSSGHLLIHTDIEEAPFELPIRFAP